MLGGFFGCRELHHPNRHRAATPTAQQRTWRGGWKRRSLACAGPPWGAGESDALRYSYGVKRFPHPPAGCAEPSLWLAYWPCCWAAAGGGPRGGPTTGDRAVYPPWNGFSAFTTDDCDYCDAAGARWPV